MQTLRIAPDHKLSYTEFGKPNGYPILVQHGLIASIKDGDLFEQLTSAGARVICIARPGYGESSAYEMHSVGEWGEMINELVSHLKLTQFDVLGISSGAPYSYAIGCALPESTRNIFIFSGIPAMYDDGVIAHWPFPVQKNAAVEEMKRLANDFFFSNLTAEDLLKNDIRDSMANEGYGIALDFRLRCMDWGFTLAGIKHKVIMRHARFDVNVPLICAELTAAMLPNALLKMEENDIHFSQETLDDFIGSAIIPRLQERMCV